MLSNICLALHVWNVCLALCAWLWVSGVVCLASCICHNVSSVCAWRTRSVFCSWHEYQHYRFCVASVPGIVCLVLQAQFCGLGRCARNATSHSVCLESHRMSGMVLLGFGPGIVFRKRVPHVICLCSQNSAFAGCSWRCVMGAQLSL